MDNPVLPGDSILPLKLIGVEADTTRDVYHPTCELDFSLLHLLEMYGYTICPDIELADGRVVDGWVKNQGISD